MKILATKTIEQLRSISTASIASFLYKKGLRNQYIQNVFPIQQAKQRMVGQAFTLRYIPAREDLNPISIFQDPKHPQRVAIESCPKGFVLVIDSRNNARAASAGSILITRLMKRGAAGIVTDGGFRDVEEIGNLDFPAFHQKPSAPTNLTLNQALDMNVPIGCGDAAVFPGDVLVGDNDGVMVIPLHLVEETVKECSKMELYEQFVLERVNEGATIIGLYPPTDPKNLEAFEKWKSTR
jgi:regulator of RNase E activity RraA